MENLGLILAVALISLFAIIAIFHAFRSRSRKHLFDVPTKKYIQAQWQEVEELPRERLREAIMEADKILDYTLGKLGVTGGVMDKIKKSKHHFSDPEPVFAAHKFRNRLAHEISFKPGVPELRQKLGMFKAALHDLGIFKI